MNTPAPRPISPGKAKSQEDFLNMTEKKEETPSPAPSGNRKYPYLDRNSELKKSATFRITDKLHARLDFASKRVGLSMSDFIEETLQKRIKEIFDEDYLPWD